MNQPSNSNIADLLAGLQSRAATPSAPPAPAAPPQASAPAQPASPYSVVAPQRKVTGASGEAFAPTNEKGGSLMSTTADESGRVGYVSRHSLMGSGVTCPLCGALAADANDWHAVHLDRKYGEGVSCFSCNAMLWAAPDDDIDPVKPDQPYDEGVYHMFARPAGWEPPRQRTTSDPLQIDDWVVIERFTGPVYIQGKVGKPLDLDRMEGKVVGIVDENLVDVALAGNEGMGAAGLGSKDNGGVYAQIPRTNVFKAILPVLVKGDKIRVIRGPRRGATGTLLLTERNADVRVQLDGMPAPLTLPIEIVARVVPNERLT
jgi:hypothetical protein